MSGQQDRSLLGLVGATAHATSAGRGRRRSMVAIVTDIKDPEELGRVKVKFPSLADDYESDWARVVLPGAGEDTGLVFLPDVDDEVLVAFEHGDMRRPLRARRTLEHGAPKPPLGDGPVRQRPQPARRASSPVATTGWSSSTTTRIRRSP